MKIKLKEINNRLKEADVLLFRCPNFPNLGWWISKYTNSPYSHIGIVHFIDDEPYCIEFKEFVGCRMHPLKEYIQKHCDKIDVFRTADQVTYQNEIYWFTEDVAKNITEDAKGFIGQKYGWTLIFMIVRAYIPIIRFFLSPAIIDIDNPASFVCSTFISYLWRKHYIDIVSFLPDSYTKPSDIARSPLLRYTYTLSCEV